MSAAHHGARAAERQRLADAEFRAFVADPRFPCLAAKGVVRGAGFRLGVYGTLGSARSAAQLAHDLATYIAGLPADGVPLQSYVAVFPHAPPKDELEFERRLWLALRHLHAHDAPQASWDPSVSDDPDDSHFSFSFAGRALFVVGVHRASSRLARQFRWPALAFNPHAQFERLREDGRFAPLRAAVREREIALQGTLNPNLADFGDRSEARQYSGRAVDDEWRCPFHHTRP